MKGGRLARLTGGLLTIGLAAAVGGGFGLRQAATAAADEDAPSLSAARVVVVGIPGLLWGDVASGVAPELTELATDAGLGQMTVRAARSRTCILDGWATLGAGNRARYPAPTVDLEANLPPLSPEDQSQSGPSLAGCGQQEQVALSGLTDVVPTVRRIEQDAGTRRFAAEPGALGEAVECSVAIGRASAIAVAGAQADVSVIDELATGAALTSSLNRCPLSVISLPALIGSVPTVSLAARQDGPDTASLAEQLGRARAVALRELDGEIDEIRSAIDALPGTTLLLVAGLSEKGISRAQLHPLIAVHPDLPPGYLTSSSTGRTPYVQLIDVAPTALRALGLEDPDSMVGSPMRWAGPTASFEAAMTELRDLNRVAVAHLGLTRTFFWTLVALAAALVAGLLVGLALGGRREMGGRSPPGRVLPVAALALAALPAATHLANLTPWWRSPQREVTLALTVAGILALLVTLALVLGGRRVAARFLPATRSWAGPPVVVLVVTALTVGLDVAAGSPMELNALLGYNPIVAGRFVGLGNLAFGLFAVCTLLATGVLVRGGTARVLAGIGVIGVLAVIGVGAPGLGRDFGGVLALVPAFLLLAFLVTETRLSPRRVLGIGAVTLLAVSTFALFDYSRAPDDRTHLGRFVAQLLDGQAWTVVARKAQANLDVLSGSPVTWLAPIFFVAVWVMVRHGVLRELLAAEPRWRAGLFAATLSVGIGAIINDSGIAVPAIAGIVVVPVLIWLTQHWKASGADHPASRQLDTPIADSESRPARVSVNSRESTG